MVAIGQVSTGLVLVGAFSLGLAGALTALGLVLITAKRWMTTISIAKLPTQWTRLSWLKRRGSRVLPALSALVITLVGCGIAIQSVLQISGITQ
jgi:nickel/cobalt transporter (NicO) family protein